MMKPNSFLDPRLENSSTFVTDLNLCQVRLSNNAAFPWVLLIPKKNNCTEIVDLSTTDQHILMSEIVSASQIVRSLFSPDKINVASLGNVVPQLHIHVVARYEKDKAWPHPIWNSGISEEYDPTAKIIRIEQLKNSFELPSQ